MNVYEKPFTQKHESKNIVQGSFGLYYTTLYYTYYYTTLYYRY